MAVDGTDLGIVGASFDLHVDTLTPWGELTWGPISVKIRIKQKEEYAPILSKPPETTVYEVSLGIPDKSDYLEVNLGSKTSYLIDVSIIEEIEVYIVWLDQKVYVKQGDYPVNDPDFTLSFGILDNVLYQDCPL